MLPHPDGCCRGCPQADLWTPHPSVGGSCHHECRRRSEEGAVPAERVLTLTDVGEILNVSPAQTYALVRNGDLRAVKIGGRGQWRVERTELEAYIQRMYDETARFIGRESADSEPPNLE
jgi:excisionase family DNA binding protein